VVFLLLVLRFHALLPAQRLNKQVQYGLKVICDIIFRKEHIMTRVRITDNEIFETFMEDIVFAHGVAGSDQAREHNELLTLGVFKGISNEAFAQLDTSTVSLNGVLAESLELTASKVGEPLVKYLMQHDNPHLKGVKLDRVLLTDLKKPEKVLLLAASVRAVSSRFSDAFTQSFHVGMNPSMGGTAPIRVMTAMPFAEATPYVMGSLERLFVPMRFPRVED
jgi:hypothetical protein